MSVKPDKTEFTFEIQMWIIILLLFLLVLVSQR